jgi:putative spermidine/putrescine transport system substrate-binding protein/spermidine/putrescine transport system substrate-binding protein
MKKSMFVWILAAVMIFILIGTFPLLGGGSKEKGKKPNEINLLIFEGYGEPGWVNPFVEETGAQVNITNATSVDEIFSKMVADGGKGFDLVTIDTSLFQRYYDKNLMLPINLDNIPRYRTDVLPEFHDLKETTFNGEQYGIPYAWGTIPLFYDADMIPREPDSWGIMMEPKYKGKVVLLDEPQNTMVTMALFLGGFRDLWNFSESDYDRLKEGFLAVAPQLRTLTTGATDEINLLANKEVVLGMAFGEQTGFVANQKGMKVKMTIPKEGGIGWLDCWIISAGTQNQELAEQWINHAIRKDYNKMMADTIGYPGTSNPPEGIDYVMDRIVWLQPRGDYQMLTEKWSEIKLLMGQ